MDGMSLNVLSCVTLDDHSMMSVYLYTVLRGLHVMEE